jgi:hypothetical protein
MFIFFQRSDSEMIILINVTDQLINIFLTQQYRLFSNYSASLQMDIC